jgi:hypothetical protein
VVFGLGVTGQLHVLDCRDTEDFSTSTWDMKADFFGGEPIEDVDRASPENRLEIRIQNNGAHVEESDTLLISIPDVRKAAEEWLRRGGANGGMGSALDVRPDGLVRASLSLFATCPIVRPGSAIETLNADGPSQIVFTRFGSAAPGKVGSDFIVDFGDTIETLPGKAGFTLQLVDLRAQTLGESPRASGSLQGSFSFELRRGAAGQSFP